MTDIEQKALALLNEVNKERHGNPDWYEGLNRTNNTPAEALCRAIERHEAFAQEVSDAVVEFYGSHHNAIGEPLSEFIIPAPKSDPLVKIMEALDGEWTPNEYAKEIRAALDALGFEIREKNDD